MANKNNIISNKVPECFCEIPCLTEKSNILRGIVLLKKWFPSADKRYIGQYLQKFINYNSELFDFIGVSPHLIGSDRNVSIVFRTSKYIGSIPLRSPDTGRQIGDFVVTPRFTEESNKNRYEDYIEILNMLDSEINPESCDSLPLISGRNFRPPMYLEASKFIFALEKMIKKSWTKFNRIEVILNRPIGQVNWNKYVNNEYKIENRLRFPAGRNILNELHKEYSEIRYVFDICKKELLSSNTPLRIKLSVKPIIDYLEDKLYLHIPVMVSKILIKHSDTSIVKYCKTMANKILAFSFSDSTAWRVDFSDVFEKYVQYIFKEVAKESGGKLLSNYKFKGYSSRHNAWELSHIEPDAIFQKNGLLIFIDAKYKSHLYNKHENSEFLKGEHRHDIHQILAYTSFSKTQSKYGFLCYPSKKIEINEMQYSNPINQTKDKISIIGLPIKKEVVNKARDLLVSFLTDLESE